MKVDVMASCGNAPKTERVVDLSIALAKASFKDVKPLVRNDFIWKTVGSEGHTAYDQLPKLFKSFKQKTTEITVTNALSHGNGAMAEGIMTFDDGSSYNFCNVAEFVNTRKDALVKSLHTYITASKNDK